MKRAIAIFLSLAIVIALCPAMISSASEGGEKIDLSGYLDGMTNISKFAQPVATASASYENWGLGIAALLDGNLGTRFIGVNEADVNAAAAFTPMWIQLDLQEVYTIGAVEFNSWQNGTKAGLPTAFTIQVSTDGTEWTTVHTETDLPLTTVANSSLYSFSFDAVDARYVKLDVTAIGGACDVGNYVCLSELSVFTGIKAEEVVPSTSPEIDLTGYVAGMTNASGFAQNVISTNHSEEAWGLGVASLIDGKTVGDPRYIGTGSSTFDPTWILIDLQKVYTVDKFAFYSWYYNNNPGMPKDFTIETSLDGETWTVVHTQTDLAITEVPNSNLYEFSFKAVDARYVKLNVTAIGANADTGPHLCLCEVKVFGVDKTAEGGDEEVIVPVGEKINLSGATASESLEMWGFGVANLIDDSLDTKFASESTGAGVTEFKETWITVDLGKAYMVDQFKYFSYAAGEQGRPNNIVIEVSADGESWTEAYKNENVPLTTVADSVEYAFAFKAVEAQYVRLTVKGVAANWDLGPCVCLREIEVYGVEKTEGGNEEVIVPVGDKIDLSGYVAGMTSPSGYAQTVVTTSASLEIWGFGQASLIDGNIFNINANQYYCSEPTGSGTTSFTEAWIQLDLQKVYTVDQFKFYSFMAADRGRPNNIVIETSLDGETWTVAYKNENVPLTTVADSVEYAFAFKAVDARYVKLTVKGVADNWDLGPCVCLREVEVYGKTTEEVVRGEKLEINPAKVTVSGEYTPNMGKNNLFDGKLDSIFAAIDPAKAPGTRMDEWFQIDLQQSYTVNQIRMANRSDAVPLGGLPSTFDIMVSDDGETWKVVKSVDGISESDIVDKHWLIVDFDPVEARYVRVRAYDIGAIAEATLGYAVTLREFEVHTAEGKIDLSSYVNLEDWSGHPGENSQFKSYASNYPQNVVTASQSYELWGWGIAGLIDGVVGTESIFCCRVNSDAVGPVQSMKNEITVDLGAAYFLDTMRFASMAANSLAGLPIDFKLEVSLTGAQWRTVLNKTKLSTADAEADGQFYTFAFDPTEAIRFVRLIVTKVSEAASEELGYCAALSELELYGTLDPTTVVKPDGYGQIDLSKAIIRATNSYNLWGHGTGNLYNGSLNGNMFIGISVDDADYYLMFKDTEVFENTSNEFIKIRLDGIYEIDLMRFQSQFAGSAKGVPNSYTLEVSMDGKTWTTALFVDGKSVSSDGWYSDDIVPVQARYLRLKFHNFIAAGDLGYAAHLKELEFYGVMLEKDQIDLDVPTPEPPALDPLPGDSAQTGDATTILVCATMTVATLMLAVLVLNRRKFAQ